jgi:hypothetical protein
LAGSVQNERLTLDEALHVDTRQVDLVGVQLARLHQLLHLHDAHLGGLERR